MGSDHDDIQAAVERHSREIEDLKAQLQALREGTARREMQAKIDRRMAELEAEIKAQQLQETIAREQEQVNKSRKGRFFKRGS